MTISPEMPPSQPTTPYFSRAGLVAGVIAMAPMLVSQTAFGFIVGTLSAQKALTEFEALAMSGLVFAGLSQVVGLQSWPQDFTWATMVALAIATFTVNLRFFLMSLTYRSWLAPLPAWKSYPVLLLTTDPGWLQSMRYYEQGGRDASFLLGGGGLVYFVWLLSTYFGYTFSSWLTDPKRFGIDLLIPAFFVALLIPAWKGAWRAVPWVAAGIVGVIVEQFGYGYWSIVAGAVSGAVTAGLMHDG